MEPCRACDSSTYGAIASTASIGRWQNPARGVVAILSGIVTQASAFAAMTGTIFPFLDDGRRRDVRTWRLRWLAFARPVARQPLAILLLRRGSPPFSAFSTTSRRSSRSRP
jgi:hypothetical protein